VPKHVGDIFLYGKETDRPARAEFTTIKTSDYDTKLKHFLDCLGSFAGERLGEEETGRIPSVTAALSINWRFPDDTPLEHRKRLIQEQRTLALLSIWPNLPMGALDGRSPRQASSVARSACRRSTRSILPRCASSRSRRPGKCGWKPTR
jgi:hypothetical protein